MKERVAPNIHHSEIVEVAMRRTLVVARRRFYSSLNLDETLIVTNSCAKVLVFI